MKRRVLPLSLALLFAISGCGGGGSGSSAIPLPSKSTPSAAGSASVHVTIPSAQPSAGTKKRSYIGSDVQGIVIVAAPHGTTSGVTTAFDVSPGSTLCVTSGSGRSCTLLVPTPFGTVDFLITTYDTAPVNGVIPAGAKVLGTSSLTNVTITAGAPPPTVSFTVTGQVARVTVSVSSQVTIRADGTTHAQTYSTSGYDSSGIPIVGTFANPITVSVQETGGSGHTSLTLNGTPSNTSATLASSTDQFGIVYDGGGASGYYATVTVSAAGATGKTFTVVPIYISSTSPYYSAANGLVFTGPNESASLAVSEAIAATTYTVTTTPCAGSATATVSGSGQSAIVTVTSGSTPVAGCPIQINDSASGIVQIYVQNTITTGGITIGGITEYTIPGTSLRLTGMVTGTDGNLYAVETLGSPTGTNHIDQISTSGALLHQFTIPTSNANPNQLAVAPDGTLWFAEGGSYKFGSLNPTTGTFAEYNTPGFPTSTLPQAVAVGRDGYIYFLDRQTYTLYQYTTTGTLVTSTTLGGTATPTPYALAVGSDGNIYVLDTANNRIAVANVCCNPSYESIPTANAGATNITGAFSGQIWFTESNANKIGNVATGTGGTPAEYATGGADQPGGLTIGPDGNLWICAPGTNQILRFDLASLTVTGRYSIPTSNASPYGITTGPDGRIWFTEFNTNKVGVLTP